MSRESDATNAQNEYFEEKKLAWERRKLGIELRHKFEFYFVVLSFSILGVVIQTAKKSGIICLDALEIFSWVSIFASGCIGLYTINKLWIREVGAAELHIRSLNSANIKQLKEEVENLEGLIVSLLKLKYVVFALGMTILIIVRATQYIS